MISDGLESYTIFQYADGLIEWITRENLFITQEITITQVGFDAGDGVWFKTLPESGTPQIINITRTSNLRKSGVWAFKLDEGVSECRMGKNNMYIIRDMCNKMFIS